MARLNNVRVRGLNRKACKRSFDIMEYFYAGNLIFRVWFIESAESKSKNNAGIQIIQNGDEICINIDGKIEILTNRSNDRKIISMSPQVRRRCPVDNSKQWKSDTNNQEPTTYTSKSKRLHICVQNFKIISKWVAIISEPRIITFIWLNLKCESNYGALSLKLNNPLILYRI